MSSISSVSSSMSSILLKQMQEEMSKSANDDSSTSTEELTVLESIQDSDSSDTESTLALLDSDNNEAISRLESDTAIAKLSQNMQSQSASFKAPSAGPPPSGGAAPSSAGISGDDEEEEYDEMDTNKDGVVSMSERAAAMSALGLDSPPSEPESLLDTISNALEAGDTAAAQAALTALQEQAARRSNGRTDDPFIKDLQALSSAIESGDISSAQALVAGIEEKMSGNGAGHQPPGGGAGQDDAVAQTLQKMLDAIEESPELDDSSTLKNVLIAALNSYREQSTSTFTDNLSSSMAVSALA